MVNGNTTVQQAVDGVNNTGTIQTFRVYGNPNVKLSTATPSSEGN
jgi:hypothetical protein